MPSQKKNTFYGAAAVLAMTTILVKVIGALYKIPLTALLTAEAYADFNAAYNIYTVFLTFSTAGLPVALSKTVSECNALGLHNQKERVFRVALAAFLVLGSISFVCMSLFSPIVAQYVLQNEKANFAVLALSPAVLCTCCSAFRGYAQGHMNMVPTGVSQVIEALCKLLLGLALAVFVLHAALPIDQDTRERLSAAGALAGVSIGAILSLCYLIVNHIRTKRREHVTATDRADSSRDILGQLLRIAIPICLSSCTLSIVNLIDTGLVQTPSSRACSGPCRAGSPMCPTALWTSSPRRWRCSRSNLADPQADPILDSARSLYGTYGKTMSVYNLPFNLMVPLTACIVPGVSACIARRDRVGAGRTTESAMRMAALIALPCGAGLLALGGPIVKVVTVGNVDASIAGPLLSILGIASAFVCIQTVATSILQANGIVNLPILTMIIGGVSKVIVSYTLVGNPKFMIYGAPAGTLTCFAVVVALNLLLIKRMVPHAPRYHLVFLKPLLASVVMGAAAWAAHGLLSRFLSGSFLLDAAATAGAILVGVVVYAAIW